MLNTEMIFNVVLSSHFHYKKILINNFLLESPLASFVFPEFVKRSVGLLVFSEILGNGKMDKKRKSPIDNLKIYNIFAMVLTPLTRFNKMVIKCISFKNLPHDLLH
jgi:hypothetical protein